MKLVILDRDGVINHDSDDYIKSPEEFIPIDGSLNAIAQLNHAGYKVVVCSNQSGIGRGYFDLDTLNRMHDKLHTLLQHEGGHIDAILFCPHHPDDGCDCRKPKPGMIKEARTRFNIPSSDITFIGDTLSDLKAANAAEINFMLVKTGKGKRTLKKHKKDEILDGVPVFDDLSDAVHHLMSNS